MTLWNIFNFVSHDTVWYKPNQLTFVSHSLKARFALTFPCRMITLLCWFCQLIFWRENNTELWSLRPSGAMILTGEQTSLIFVKIKSNSASFLVGALTICFREKCLSRDEIGHLLKSPTRKMPAIGYMTSARSSFAIRWSINALCRYLEGYKLRKRSDTKILEIVYVVGYVTKVSQNYHHVTRLVL
jgi:hypothetical protein